MLASERVVGPELGEDRDHHAPNEVAPLRVLQRLLQALEGRPRVARVPGLEGRLRAPGRPASCARATRPVRDEVARERLEQLERLARSRRARSSSLPSSRRAVAWSGSISRARRSDSSSPPAASSSASEGTSASKKRSTSAGGSAPVNSDGDATVPERLDRRDALDAEERLELRVAVDVDLGQLDLARARGHRALQHRRELLAGAAPLGPEVDDDRQLRRARDHALARSPPRRRRRRR